LAIQEDIMPSDPSLSSTLERPFKTSADFEYLRQVIMREVTDGPVPIFEMMADGSIMGQATGMDYSVDQMTEISEMFTHSKYSPEEVLERYMQFMNLGISFSRDVGYDSALGFVSVPVPRTLAVFSETDDNGLSARPWQNEHSGLIPDRAAFEAFSWPSVEGISLGLFDQMAESMPPGMKIHVMHMGIFEDLRSLMGFETMAYASVDDTGLVSDILGKLTTLAEAAVDKAAAHPSVGMIIYADDMGFKTSTMLSPDFFRRHVLPGQKRCADACHRHGKPFVLHSCGQIDALMDDLIDVVGIDGLHSFEDLIEPVESVYERYGDRISILGGVDVGLLSAGSPGQVRARVRQILDVCGRNGGFALGSGNSVPNYAKIENYYAMIDETRRWNEEQGLIFG
jgi:uroporphyrinogen decarboxylase